MPLALYTDVHVPMAVTEALRRRGLDILTSQDDGTAQEDDERLVARATELGRVFFSQDQDFLRIAAEWQRVGRRFGGILFAAQQGVSLGLLAYDLELVLTCCEPAEQQNLVTYLPLRYAWLSLSTSQDATSRDLVIGAEPMYGRTGFGPFELDSAARRPPVTDMIVWVMEQMQDGA